MKKFVLLGMFVALSAALPITLMGARRIYPGLSIAVMTYSYALTVSLLFAGVALYALRRSFRLLYGAVEIAIAIVVIYISFKASALIIDSLGAQVVIRVFGNEQSVRLPPTSQEYERAFSSILQVAAALYILVRGLDNISAGLPTGSRAQVLWDRIFPDK